MVQLIWSRFWRRKWKPTAALLPGKSHGQRSLVGYSPWSRTESDVTQHSTAVWIQLGGCFRQDAAVWAGFQAWGWPQLSSPGVCSGAWAKEVVADSLAVDHQSSRKEMQTRQVQSRHRAYHVHILQLKSVTWPRPTSIRVTR